jgi:hypothetical protein
VSAIRPALERRQVLAPVLCTLIAGIAGVAVGISPHAALGLSAIAAIGALGLACASPAGIRFLLTALILSTFVTRFKFDVLGFHFRPENGLVLAAAVALVASSRSSHRLGAAARRAPVALLGLYVVWTGIVSAFIPPQPRASLAITGWLALDWLTLCVLVAGFTSADEIEEMGTKWACVAFAVADLLYFVGPRLGYGVQKETVTGANAAYGLSYEANILGSTAAIWLFLAISSPKGLSTWSRRLILPLGLFALIVSFTRAADVALAAGLAVWALLEGYRARRVLVRRLGPMLVAATLLLAAIPSIGGPVLSKLTQVASVQSSTGAVRVAASAQALGDLAHFNWVVGLGANSFGQRHTDATLPGQDVSGYLGVLPLELLYGEGVIGIACLCVAFLAIRPWRLKRPARALGLVVVYVVASLATSPFWFASSWLIMALALLAERAPTPSHA